MPNKASVKIAVTCSDGHEVFMFPDRCMNIFTKFEDDGSSYPVCIFTWQCPRCTGEMGQEVNEVYL